MLKKQVYYAIKALLFFDVNRSAVISITEAAHRLDIPEKVMEQVLLMLKNLGFLRSKRGPQGGYSIDVDLRELTVLDLVDKLSPKADMNGNKAENEQNPFDETIDDFMKEMNGSRDLFLGSVCLAELKANLMEKITEKSFFYNI